MKITKKELNQYLVEERKKSRTKAQQSAFMKKTLSIYNGQKKRAAEFKQTIPFTLQQFREFFGLYLGTNCPFSGQKLTLSNATADHSKPIARGGGFDLANLMVITQSSNFQKGIWTTDSFRRLLEFLTTVDKVEREDLLRRATIGGKWGLR